MHYSTFFLYAVAATGAIAAPNRKPLSPMGIRISLDPSFSVSQRRYDSDKDFEHTFTHKGPFKKVTLELGPRVKNQDVRCQILDDQEQPKPIIITRRQNIDNTFAKGDPWTLNKESKVTKVICGPKQLKTDQTTVKDITVSLKKKAEPGIVTTAEVSETKFEEAMLPQEKKPEGLEKKMYDQVKLTVGFAVKNRALRCKVLDTSETPIIVTRGKNIDFSFGDGDNPAIWEFANGPSEVSKIVCDEAFKKDDASDEVNKGESESEDMGMDIDIDSSVPEQVDEPEVVVN